MSFPHGNHFRATIRHGLALKAITVRRAADLMNPEQHLRSDPFQWLARNIVWFARQAG